MGATKKAKVTFTCEFTMKDYLSEWADDENRTISNLVETLVGEAIAARLAKQNGTPASDTQSTGDKGRKKKSPS